MADALVRRLGDAPDSTTARLNMAMIPPALYPVLGVAPGGHDAGPWQGHLHTKETLGPAGALDHLTRAAKNDADLRARVREEARKEAEARMEAALEEAAGEVTAKALTPLEALERVKAVYRGEA